MESGRSAQRSTSAAGRTDRGQKPVGVRRRAAGIGRRWIAVLVLGCLGGWAGSTAPASWPQFRGPGGSGVAEEGDFPVVFGPETNLVWRVPLPAGNSSPCIWENRIFLTGHRDSEVETLCLDRSSGVVLWRQPILLPPIGAGGGSGNLASPTPVTDGRRVYVYFGPFGLVCYDLGGAEQWRRPLPMPVTQHGVGTSPVLADGRLLVVRDQDVDSHLLAVDAGSGEIVWRVERPGFRRGFATPLVWAADGERQVAIAGTLQVVAYRVADGAERWRVAGLPNELCATPVAGAGLLFAGGWTPGSGVARMPGFAGLIESNDRDQDGELGEAEATGPARQHFNYIDADRNGRLTRAEYEAIAAIFDQARNAVLALRPPSPGAPGPPRVLWQATRGLPYVPSPLFYRDRLYLVKNGGLVSCLNATNGTPSYLEERLEALGDYYASPVAANGKICVAAQPGTLVVFKAGDTLEVMGRNRLGETVMATPAIVERTLYVRSHGHLWAFRETN